MGLFGGSSQSTSSSSNVLDFNPVFNIGDSNSASQEKSLDTAQTISPQQKDEASLSWDFLNPKVSASAGVAMAPGSSAMGGTSSLSDESGQAQQPMQTATASNANTLSSINPIYLIGGIGLIGLILVMKKTKKKKG